MKLLYHTLLLTSFCLAINSLNATPNNVQINYRDDPLIRHTTNGPVLGEKRNNSISEEQYFAFHAIPYAAPPLKTLRFMPPVQHENWIDVYNASLPDVRNKCCPQPNWIPDETNEDCLYLSVYTPMERSSIVADTELLPVMVWIHGGGFTTGCGLFQFYGPNRYMKGNDIVMVSINYRLGLLGFLSLANEHIPGNFGLLDQVRALEWVQENIREFGGNPNMVTIAGESAGSWAVGYHMMSPLSANLFHQVIGQSGAVVSPAYREYTNEEVTRWGKMAVSSVGCDANTQFLVDCLQNTSVQNFYNGSEVQGHLGAQAVVDGGFSNTPFLPDHPIALMASGEYNYNVNVLLGSNRDEGLLFTGEAASGGAENETFLQNWKNTWRNGGQGAFILLGVDFGYQDASILAAVDKITEFYIGSLDNMNIEKMAMITQMITDAWFSYGEHNFVTRHMPKSLPNSIFQYLYTHEGEISLTEVEGFDGPYGVAHGDEMFVQFIPSAYAPGHELNNADQVVSDNLIRLWKKFIITGNPSTAEVNWNPIKSAVDRRYLRLTYAASSYMEYSKNWQDRMALWDEVMEKLVPSLGFRTVKNASTAFFIIWSVIVVVSTSIWMAHHLQD